MKKTWRVLIVVGALASAIALETTWTRGAVNPVDVLEQLVGAAYASDWWNGG